MQPFEIHDVPSVQDASNLLSEYGDNARLYAGGTELLLVMKSGILHYDHLINIKTVPGLNAIQYGEVDHELTIGALATHRQLERSEVVQRWLPLLAQVEREIANVRVRNVGTIGGNMCFAEPHSDPATLFLALGAQFKLASATMERTLSVDEFLVDAYEPALQPDELLTGIRVPLPGASTHGGYQRFQFHERPTVSVAVLLTLDDAHEGIKDVIVTVGCVNPKPFRATEAEALLRGKSVEEAQIASDKAGKAAAEMADPSDDLNGSSAYKKQLVAILVQRAFLQAYTRFD